MPMPPELRARLDGLSASNMGAAFPKMEIFKLTKQPWRSANGFCDLDWKHGTSPNLREDATFPSPKSKQLSSATTTTWSRSKSIAACHKLNMRSNSC